MTIEVHQPELEAIIQQRMATGRFRDIEDVILQALKNSPEADEQAGQSNSNESLDQMFAKVRGLFTEEELDFSRDPSPGRPVDFS